MIKKFWKKQSYLEDLMIKGACLFDKIDEMSEMLAQDYPRQHIINKAHEIARVNTEISDLMTQACNEGIELSIEAEAHVMLPWEE